MMSKAILVIILTLTVTLTVHAATLTPDVSFVKIRASRFLKQDPTVRNPRAADHCHKDGEVCAATNTHCCNNKCVDLQYDSHNCGACKNKCKFTQVCCKGQCVNLSFDKRHCGSCGNKCMKGGYCIYGMCDYA